jgi:hypothetical protein
LTGGPPGGGCGDLERANSGFAGVVADHDSGGLTLYWVQGQPLPPEISQIVANPGSLIHIERVDATYSRTQLNSTADGLLDEIANELQGHANTMGTSLCNQISGFLHEIEVPEEGTGLIGRVEPYDRASFDANAAGEILTGAAGGVPVHVEVGQPSVATAGRLNDASPWKAGGRITQPDPSGAFVHECSAGFGIVGPQNKKYMMTAAHCFKVNTQVNNGNVANPTALGNVTSRDEPSDSEIIAVNQADPKIFTGGVGGVGAAEGSADVIGTQGKLRGTENVCTSGTSTGENCKLEVKATNTRGFARLGFLNWVRVVVVTAKSTIVDEDGPTVAVGHGDSGGPVEVIDKNGKRKALGIISAENLDNQVSCRLFRAEKKKCSSTVYYFSIDPLLRGYGATLVQPPQ